MKKLNLPNRLTILRIVLVPVLVFFMLDKTIPFSMAWALIIFSVVSFTDYLDGKIARSRNLITDFGKFLDPMADKILVISVMVCFESMGICNPVALIIVIIREFLVSSMRLIAASQGVVLAAGKTGKVKTAVQMLSIVVILILLSAQQIFKTALHAETTGNVLFWITAALAIISGVEYVIKNKNLILP